jgi:16S rRNA (cytosine967-C5)-methyltransferase
LKARIAEQANILAAAAVLVKPGGRLVYATCSILPAENDGQMARFLSDHPDFAAQPSEMIAFETLGAEAGPEFIASVHLGSHGLTMTPLKTGTDGFYVSVLARQS